MQKTFDISTAADRVRRNSHLVESEKYIEGIQKLGDDLLARQRIKEKETKQGPKGEFIQYSRPDVWESTLHTSQTNRTKANDDLFDVSPVYDNFSKNKYLDYYKDNLVKTGNLDHIVPFKHSLSQRGLKMDSLRQNVHVKNYPTSRTEELSREYQSILTQRKERTDRVSTTYSPHKRDEGNSFENTLASVAGQKPQKVFQFTKMYAQEKNTVITEEKLEAGAFSAKKRKVSLQQPCHRTSPTRRSTKRGRRTCR